MTLQRASLDEILTCTRASSALVRNAAGVWSSVGNNVLRRSHEGGAFCLLAEETRTNSLPRNDMSGAAVGVVGSGGALPSGWGVFGMPAGTVSVVTVANKNGLPRLQIRLNGTPTSSFVSIAFTAATAVTAAQNETWTASVWVQQVGGDQTNISQLRCQIQELDVSGGILASSNTIFTETATSDLRREVSRTMASASTGRVLSLVQLVTSGAIDITLDISAPQLEQGAFATSPVISTGSAVTRQADQITLNAGLLSQIYGGGPVSVLTKFESQYVTGGTGFPTIWCMDDGTANNRFIQFVGEGAGTVVMQTNVAGSVVQADGAAYTSGALLKIATRFEANNSAVSRNGGAVTTDTSMALPTGLVNLGISNRGDSPTSTPARILRLRQMVIAIGAETDAGLQAWSA